jgi:hypothetical protein
MHDAQRPQVGSGQVGSGFLASFPDRGAHRVFTCVSLTGGSLGYMGLLGTYRVERT